jgi:hypothetical protein
MKQATLSMTGYFDKGKKTKRERFLAEMEQACRGHGCVR